MSRRSHWFKSTEGMKRSLTWDFSNAKGAGANVVVDYDHHKNRVSSAPEIYTPAQIEAVRARRKQRDPVVEPLDVRRVLLDHGVDAQDFIATARRLAALSRDPFRPIPNELRAALAVAIERAGGGRDVADQVRLGKMDDHIHGLARRR